MSEDQCDDNFGNNRMSPKEINYETLEDTLPDPIEPLEMTYHEPHDSQTYFVIKDIHTDIPPLSVAATECDLDKTSLEVTKSQELFSENNLEDILYECTVCGKVL